MNIGSNGLSRDGEPTCTRDDHENKVDAPAVTYFFVINILTLLKPVPVWTACWSGFTPIENFYVVYM